MTQATLQAGEKAVRITIDKKFAVVEMVEDGKVKDKDRFNPDLRARRVELARRIGVDDATLISYIDSARETALKGDARPQTFTLPRPEFASGDVVVRGFEERDDQGTKYPMNPVVVLREILVGLPNDRLITWKGGEQLCCLDIDYHEIGLPAPHESWLRARVTADLAPRPYAWHFSRRGGLHLFYIAAGPFTAEELAAAAALAWRRIDAVGTVELKTTLRGPGDKTVHFAPADTQDTTALLRGWVDATPDDEARIAEWMEAEGFEAGRRYDHTKCPIHPTPGHASTGEPVTVTDKGIYCHNCAGQGYTFGTRRPGFAPFMKLVGGERSGEIGDMIRAICHWGHARYVLTTKYGLVETLAKQAYSAALKAYHHGTERAALIPLAFSDGSDRFTRVNHDWVTLEDEGKNFNRDDQPAILHTLPAANRVDADGKVKPDPAAVANLRQTHGIEHRGYPRIVTIHGFRMSKVHLADPSNEPTMIEVYRSDLKGDGGRYLPKYVPASRRNVEKAWRALELIFPNVDRKLVETVMVAITCAQDFSRGMHPMMFIAGPSGAAKTTTPRIAAAIMGTSGNDVKYATEDRWTQAMWTANKSGGVLLLNEIVKDKERQNYGRPISPAEPFEPLLNITPHAWTHISYAGQRQFGQLSAFVMTEPSLNVALREETQIARRLRYWDVSGKKKWDFAKWQVGEGVGNLRTLSVELDGQRVQMAEMCNWIISDLVDRFFFSHRSWDSIADELGCKLIIDHDQFEDPTPFLRDFFRLVCAAPAMKDKSAYAVRLPGFKRITRHVEGASSSDDADPLASVYSMFADGRGTLWLKSRRLNEKDWNEVLGTSFSGLKLVLTDDGSNVYARFHVGRRDKPTAVNEQIIDPSNWEAIVKG